MLHSYLYSKNGPGIRKKILQPLILVLLYTNFLISTFVYAQPNITRVEYYIDTDPGFGNGTALSIGTGTNFADLIIPINPTALAEGVHRLYVRAKSANGWSLTNTLLFYKPVAGGGAVLPAPNLLRLEYYIDNDPGFGNATALSIGTGTNFADLIIPVNPTALPVGVHRLYVRAKSANGWSLTNTLLFYKPVAGGGAVVPAPNLSRLEYYIDTDPGFGNATALSIGTGTNFADLIIPINPTALREGVHRLYVRAKSANGWSLTNTLLFYKPVAGGGTVASAPNLTRLEYYIDNDPGYGNAVPVVLDSLANFADYIVPINVTGLATGNHKFWLRGLDKNGSWSMMNSWEFTVPVLLATPSIVVNSITDVTNCARDSFNISYDKTGTYNAGNVFKAELSDAAGSFASPTIVGSYTGTGNSIIKVKLPAHLPEGTNYKLRVSSTNPVVTGFTNATSITIHDRPFAQSITGVTSANGTETWPYSIPNVASSSFNWLITNGVKTSGANTNTGNVQWDAGTANAIKPGKINIVETNQFGCVGDTSIALVNIYKLRIGISTPAAACKAFSMAVTASADGAFGAGNILTAQLSNAAGSFASPVVIGSLPLVGNGLNQPAVINTTIPAATPNGNNYRVRIISTTGAFIGDTSAAINIQKPAIGADLARSKCPGFGYNLQTDYTDGTLTYTYFNNSFVVLSNAANVDIGTYNVIGTNSNGCADTAVVTVTNNVKPNIGADTTIYHNCPGETTNLVPLYITTGLTAVWNTGTPTAAPPGIYRLIVTNASGCSDTAFANIILEVATWTGSTSNNWHTAANWNINKVPGQQTHVIIPSGTINPCNITSSDAEAASVQVKATAAITTSNGRQLMIRQNCASLPPN